MDFEWDENKDTANKLKHKFDFNKAKEIFDDPNCATFEADEEKYGEKRFLTVGKILNLLYTVVYIIRNSIIRIISARRANRFERKFYESKNNQKK